MTRLHRSDSKAIPKRPLKQGLICRPGSIDHTSRLSAGRSVLRAHGLRLALGLGMDTLRYSMSYESMLLDLCARLALLGRAQEACRIFGSPEPADVAELAAEASCDQDERVARTGRAILLLVVAGVAAAIPAFFEAFA